MDPTSSLYGNVGERAEDVQSEYFSNISKRNGNPTTQEFIDPPRTSECSHSDLNTNTSSLATLSPAQPIYACSQSSTISDATREDESAEEPKFKHQSLMQNCTYAPLSGEVKPNLKHQPSTFILDKLHSPAFVFDNGKRKKSIFSDESIKYLEETVLSSGYPDSGLKLQYRGFEDEPTHFKEFEQRYCCIHQLARIPMALRTLDVCVKTLEKHGSGLRYVPMELITPELCKIAVRSEGMSLQYVPKEWRTIEMCMLAVMACYINLPDLGIESDTDIWVTEDCIPLQYVPPALRTCKICELAVMGDGRSLKWVPSTLFTPNMCLLAVKNFGMALQYVPANWRNVQLCEEAFKSEPLCIVFIPNHLRTMKMYEHVAFQANGKGLQFVPMECRTLELCTAVAKYVRIEMNRNENKIRMYNLIKYFPENIRKLCEVMLGEC